MGKIFAVAPNNIMLGNLEELPVVLVSDGVAGGREGRHVQDILV